MTFSPVFIFGLYSNVSMEVVFGFSKLEDVTVFFEGLNVDSKLIVVGCTQFRFKG